MEAHHRVVAMTNTLADASRNTAHVIALADRARELLAGDGEPRVNAAGILADPAGYLASMKAARELIEQALAVHTATGWPSSADYRAL